MCATMLRDIEAKRARLTLMADAHEKMDRLLRADTITRTADDAMAIGSAAAATMAVKHDATIWADHADYQQRWSPTRDSL